MQSIKKCVIVYKSARKNTIRGVAQLVERVVWDHEVARSIRVAPTINFIGSPTLNRDIIEKTWYGSKSFYLPQLIL